MHYEDLFDHGNAAQPRTSAEGGGVGAGGGNYWLTSDRRQSDLARSIGLAVFNPAGQ